MTGNSEGQSLVEAALALPIFMLGLVLAVRLIDYCHNMVELQRMAMVASDRMSIEDYRAGHSYCWFHSLYGSAVPLQPSVQLQPLPVWRPFRGLFVLGKREPGVVVRVGISARLLPDALRWFSGVRQQAFAEVLLEPSLPEEE